MKGGTIYMKKRMNKKGKIAPVLLALFILLGVAVVGGVVWGITTLTITPAVAEVDYDGEFGDAYLAIKGNFYSTFTEGTDCNITSDVLGGSGYTNCIYDTVTNFTTNSTEHRLDLVFDIDGDVENLEIEGKLQNTGTGQAKDDVNILEAEIWTYEDATDTVLIYEIPIDNEDGEFEGETGVLPGDEYVLHILIKSRLVNPVFAEGDDIMKIQLDLTTDGDVDAARILLEE